MPDDARHEHRHTDSGLIPTSTGMIPVPVGTRSIPVQLQDAAGETAHVHPGDRLSPTRRFVYVLLLGALTALGPFTVDLYLPAFPVLERDFSATAAAVQLTLTGTMLGFALGQLVIGPLSDRFGRRVPLLIATGLHIVASIGSVLAPNLELLGVARVFMGIGAAGGSVVAMAMVRDLFSGRRLVIMLSRLALVTGVAPVVAPLIGSMLLGVMPWRGIFVVLACYGAVMLACALFALPETRPASDRITADTVSVRHRYRVVFSDRVYVGVLAIGALTFAGLFSYLSSSSFLFQQSYGLTAVQYGMVFAANSVGLVLGNQIAARLAARFGPQWVLAGSTAGILIAAIAIPISSSLVPNVWGLIVPLFVFMSGCGFTFPCAQVLALDRHPEAAGTAASVLGASNNLVAGLVSPIVGVLSSATGITPLTMASIMIACSALAIASLWLVVRPRTLGLLSD
ncbi:multidrug effflux MFS transporter [Microbacterium sp. Marseille-Q6965]|uniref:multidrug effflux MFS transporter n=1 Tax=Microbacterium sp. Marseille-Q6965 TaxID=2965072 RepID=UPI0021B7B746|nr:multidrug effflux MFS transporter [Microbacterium sp. Marseille-Q6965]